jgi:hypothetical protein
MEPTYRVRTLVRFDYDGSPSREAFSTADVRLLGEIASRNNVTIVIIPPHTEMRPLPVFFSCPPDMD